MDPNAEAIMRATIHDLANVLSGVRGILDISDPTLPLPPRDRSRLDAVLADGINTLGRARHLAMGTFPEALSEPGHVWRNRLLELLAPLSTIYRCPFDLRYEGDPAHDHWPGDLLRTYMHALIRQVLPYAQGESLRLICSADARLWRIAIAPASNLPESLNPGLEGRSRDTSARWALAVGASLGVGLAHEHETLVVRIPRF
jgi:hypothetical protein